MTENQLKISLTGTFGISKVMSGGFLNVSGNEKSK